ncbi:MAG: type VI secretion system protein TssA [Phycisphaerales bacterium]
MGKANVQQLLQPIAPDKPSGEDLSYDPALLELERIIPGTAEQQIGDTFVPAEEPNWRDVVDMSISLLGRTKHLRVCLYLSVGLLKLEGLPGFRDGMQVLKGTLENFWDTAYPQLDPADNNDPLERMNIIAQLAVTPGTPGDPLRLCERIQTCPVTNSRQFGRLTVRDLLIARGDLPAPEGVKPPEATLIEGAFQDTPREDVDATFSAAKEILATAEGIDKYLDSTVGVDRAPDLKTFLSAVKDAIKCIEPNWAKLTGAAASDEAGGSAGGGVAPGAAAGPGARLSGDIGSSADVVVAIDKIFRYYQHSEVSSPVPLLLRAAKRLVGKDFADIAKRLPPDAIRTVEEIARDEVP